MTPPKITPEVETVARAICLVDGRAPDVVVNGEPYWRVYVRSAIAAIDALMVPSEGMVAAAECTGIEYDDGNNRFTDYDIDDVWRAMLRAALGRDEGERG